MNVVVCISCMHQHDVSIVTRTRVQTDAVVVNQCDKNETEEYDFVNDMGKVCHVKFISTTQRGLSKSRNMAIDNAEGDICLICDDDEELCNDYEQTILSGYDLYRAADLLMFDIDRKDRTAHIATSGEGEVTFRGILRTSSLQISFKKKSIVQKGVRFDEMMGSGTGNGAGEENKFLLDCRRAGLKLFSHSHLIGTVSNDGKSQWFGGFNEKYFRNRGWEYRRWGGFVVGYLYLWYNTLTHFRAESADGIGLLSQLQLKHRGFFEKR